MQQYPVYQIVLSILILLVMLGLVFGYPAWRLAAALKLSPAWTQAGLTLTGLLLAATFASFFLFFFGMDSAGMRLLYWIAFSGFGLFILLLPLVAAKDLLWALALGGEKALNLLSGPAAGFDGGRRLFLSRAVGAGILFTGSGLAGYGLLRAARKPRILRVTVPFPNLPKSFDGFRIVNIVDLHVGPTLRAGFVRRTVDMVNSLNPDMVVLPGDLVDGSVGHLKSEVAALSDLKAPYGKFFATGNHEYYAGVLEWLAEVKRLGFDCLVNEHRVVERGGEKILLAGVTDFAEGRRVPGHVSDPFQALKGAPELPFKLLLAHQPKSIFKAESAGFDLQISGHTHGGQLYPLPWLVHLSQPYVKGLHRHGKMWIYVSQGTGYWGPPLRVGTFPEITELTLVRRERPA